MKSLIVGFSTPKYPTIIAKAIMFADKTKYDHVYIKWVWEEIDRYVIYQASSLAVNFESNKTFESRQIIVEEYGIAISDECHKKIVQFCMDNSNTPYGIKHLLGFAIVKIAKLLGKNIKNPFPSNGNTFICSQLAAEIVAQADVPLDMPIEEITPCELNRIVNKIGLKRLE